MPRLAIAAAILTLVATTACSDDGGTGSGGDGPTTIRAALAVLPDSSGATRTNGSADENGDNGDGYETITWSDLRRAAELAGVDRPDPGDQQAVVDYVSAVTGGPRGDEPSPVAALPPQVANVQRTSVSLDEFADELGWTFLDIDAFAERSTPPDSVTVIRGRVDEDALTDAMGEPEDGTWSVGREGELDVEVTSAARPLGEALFTTAVPGGIAVTRSTDLTPEVREVAQGDGASLADDPHLAALAAALDAQHAYSAMLVRPGQSVASPIRSSGESLDLCDDALPSRPDATATAIADDDGPVVLVAHAFGSRQEAEAAADAIEHIVTDGQSAMTDRPWDEVFTLDGLAATGPNGTVALARLRPKGRQPALIWNQLLVQSDNLVAAC